MYLFKSREFMLKKSSLRMWLKHFWILRAWINYEFYFSQRKKIRNLQLIWHRWHRLRGLVGRCVCWCLVNMRSWGSMKSINGIQCMTWPVHQGDVNKVEGSKAIRLYGYWSSGHPPSYRYLARRMVDGRINLRVFVESCHTHFSSKIDYEAFCSKLTTQWEQAEMMHLHIPRW